MKHIDVGRVQVTKDIKVSDSNDFYFMRSNFNIYEALYRLCLSLLLSSYRSYSVAVMMHSNLFHEVLVYFLFLFNYDFHSHEYFHLKKTQYLVTY